MNPLQIVIENSSRSYCINSHRCSAISEKLLKRYGLARMGLSIQFVGQKTMRDLNRKYRGKDRSTDVLSFPQKQFREPLRTSRVKEYPTSLVPESLGDIVISLKDAEKNARRIGQSLDREVAFLLVHGFLHLCGHDHMHPKEEAVMLEEQKILMRDLSRSKPPLWRSVATPKKTKD